MSVAYWRGFLFARVYFGERTRCTSWLRRRPDVCSAVSPTSCSCSTALDDGAAQATPASVRQGPERDASTHLFLDSRAVHLGLSEPPRPAMGACCPFRLLLIAMGVSMLLLDTLHTHALFRQFCPCLFIRSFRTLLNPSSLVSSIN